MKNQNVIQNAFPKGSILRTETIRKVKSSTKIYIIFIVARSGSTWLTELAAKGGLLGVPQEWFNEGWIHSDSEALGCKPPRLLETKNINEYVEKIVEIYRSSSNAFGVELSGAQFKMILELLEDGYSTIEGGPNFYLRRKNIVRQAISLYRSAYSGLFHSYQMEQNIRSNFDSMQYDPDKILYSMRHLLNDEIYMEEIFNTYGIVPRRFYYEDLVKNPESILRQMNIDVLGHAHCQSRLDIKSNGVMKRLADKKNDEWEVRFREENAAEIAEINRIRPPLIGSELGLGQRLHSLVHGFRSLVRWC